MKEEQVRALLIALLDESGVVWRRDMDDIRFRAERDGMIWETACRCVPDGALIYGRYPFRIPDTLRAQALEECSRINSRLLRGGIFLSEEGWTVLRTWADLDDPYLARERLARAIEYNAAVLARSWGRMARGLGPQDMM